MGTNEIHSKSTAKLPNGIRNGMKSIKKNITKQTLNRLRTQIKTMEKKMDLRYKNDCQNEAKCEIVQSAQFHFIFNSSFEAPSYPIQGNSCSKQISMRYTSNANFSFPNLFFLSHKWMLIWVFVFLNCNQHTFSANCSYYRCFANWKHRDKSKWDKKKHTHRPVNEDQIE